MGLTRKRRQELVGMSVPNALGKEPNARFFWEGKKKGLNEGEKNRQKNRKCRNGEVRKRQKEFPTAVKMEARTAGGKPKEC